MTEPFAVELKNVTKRFPAGRGVAEVVAVDTMNLTIPQGEFFTFLGPSGCGKTTTLRMIAGFEQASQGEITIAGQSMVNIPANKRPVNTVFQNYALFPHLNVAQNVGFGLRIKRVAASERERRVQEALNLVRMEGYQNRRTTQLSGGQQQRIALARALINEPTVLLLDEPLGALDLKLRKEVQLELKQLQLQLGITFIYVTHDQEEALTMSDRIAVMNDGVIQQVGHPREIYEHPRNRFVADFIGETNFINGDVVETAKFARINFDGQVISGETGERSLNIGQPVSVAIRPEKINLYPQGSLDVLKTELGLTPQDMAHIFGSQLPQSTMNVRDYLAAEEDSVVLDGHIQEATYIGTDIRYKVGLADEVNIVVRVQNFGRRYDTTFTSGDKVYVHWVAENAQVLTE